MTHVSLNATTIPYRASFDAEVESGEGDIFPDSEVRDVVAQVTSLQQQLAPDGLTDAQRGAVHWMIRQALRWPIWKYQHEVGFWERRKSSGIPMNLNDNHHLLVMHRSLDVLMGLWQTLDGSEEELCFSKFQF